jgi:hypothetical protein
MSVDSHMEPRATVKHSTRWIAFGQCCVREDARDARFDDGANVEVSRHIERSRNLERLLDASKCQFAVKKEYALRKPFTNERMSRLKC